MSPKLISAILWTLVSVNFFTLVIGGLVTWLGYAIPVRLKQFGLLPEIAIVAGFASLIVACLGLCALNYSSHHALNVYGVSCLMFVSLMVFGLPDTWNGTAPSLVAPFNLTNSSTSTSNQMTSQNATTNSSTNSSSNSASVLANLHTGGNGVIRGGLGLDIVYFALLFILHLVSASSFTFARYLKRKELEDEAEAEEDCEEQEFGLSSMDMLMGQGDGDSPIICTCQQHQQQPMAQIGNDQLQTVGQLSNKLSANELMRQNDLIRVGDEVISLSLFQRRQHQQQQQACQIPTYYAMTSNGTSSRSWARNQYANQVCCPKSNQSAAATGALSSCKSAPPNYNRSNSNNRGNHYQSVGGSASAVPLVQVQAPPAPLAHKGYYRVENKRIRSSDGDLAKSSRDSSCGDEDQQQEQHRGNNENKRDNDADDEDDEQSNRRQLRRRLSPSRGQLEDEEAGGGSCSEESYETGNRWITSSSSMRNLSQANQTATNVLHQNLALLNHLNQQQQQAAGASRQRANTMATQQLRCRCNGMNIVDQQLYQQQQLSTGMATSAATSLAARLNTTNASSPADWLDLPASKHHSHNHHHCHRAHHNCGKKGRTVQVTQYQSSQPMALLQPSAHTMPRLGSGLGAAGGGFGATTLTAGAYPINRFNHRSNLKPNKKPKSSSVLGVTAGIAAALFGGVADGIAEANGMDDGGLFSGGLSGAGELDINESALMDDNQIGFDDNNQEFNATMSDMASASFGAHMQSLSRQPVLDFTPLLELRKY